MAEHEHDLGLTHDLPRLLSRRRALGVIGGGLAAALAACGGSDEPAASGGTGSIPEETAGPFPADGSNGPNALADSGVIRRDITRSFGDASGVAEGVPARLTMTLLDVAGGGGPLAGAAVYLWHCDRGGRYSMYEEPVTQENYLRGVQPADEQGRVVFDTVFPGTYAGRWPHMHFEVYDALDADLSGAPKLRTSQLAIPQDVCDEVYATTGYEQSVANLSQLSLESDGIFADGYRSQLASWSGSAGDGIELSLNVGV